MTSVASSFLLRCRLSLEVAKSDANFEDLSKNPQALRIRVLLESEISRSNDPAIAQIKSIYGDVKSKQLYFCNPQSNEVFFFLPKDGPKKLAGKTPGAAHVASHWGGVLASNILSAQLFEKRSPVLISISDDVKNKLKGVEAFFVTSLLQRGATNKLPKSENNEKIKPTITLTLSPMQFAQSDLNRALVFHDSMHVTRSLINMPPNILNPETYESFVRDLLHSLPGQKNSSQVTMEVLSFSQLQAEGCGLISAVGQGSDIPPRILKLSYSPTGNERNTKNIAIVGKGITFDSGGLDIKQSNAMRNMKKDMGGSAAALGAFLAVVRLGVQARVSCYLALAENMVSGRAMRPGDVYKARNGMLVEIDNTDAEGRLVLADAICLALETKPDWLIDLATLTGAARIATGPSVDALFSNSEDLAELLTETSVEIGDWVWHMPLVDEYEAMFDSNVADFTNCSTSGHAGAITAALFLKKFVGTAKWTHLDTYMWVDKASEYYAEPGASGKCVRLVACAIEKFVKG